jgi:ribosomal protein S18 acetylase RimI-like enzyme
MIVLQPITPKNALSFKAIRLRALQDSPTAFGSTYAKESQLSDAEWHQRSTRWCDDKSSGFLAFDEDRGCGIVASYLDEENPQRAHLISMWVAPDHRRTGTGKMLVQAIEQWAGRHGVHTLQLMVTDCNHSAIAFYTRLGFSMTGRTEPYPNDPALLEYEMSKSIPQPEKPHFPNATHKR